MIFQTAMLMSILPDSDRIPQSCQDTEADQWGNSGLSAVPLFCIFLITDGITLSYVYWQFVFLLSVRACGHFCTNLYCTL